jgi:hypothetical protein
MRSAKVKDSRFADYEAKYGDKSWELDALEPAVLVALVEAAITQYVDQKAFDAVAHEEQVKRDQISDVAARFDEITDGGDYE